MTLDPAFEKGGKRARCDQLDMWTDGMRNHRGTLDFGAYAQANDKRYLGFQGSLFLGRGYGNDSSNAISVLNPPGYWKIHHYKGEGLEKKFKDFDRVNDLKKGSLSGKPVENPSNSAAELGRGSFKIANDLREKTLLTDKPPMVEKGVRLNFHSVLSHKYFANKEGQRSVKSEGYMYDKNAHSSKKHEMNYLLAPYQRTDKDLITNREDAIQRRNSILAHVGGDFENPKSKSPFK